MGNAIHVPLDEDARRGTFEFLEIRPKWLKQGRFVEWGDDADDSMGLASPRSEGLCAAGVVASAVCHAPCQDNDVDAGVNLAALCADA
jgi:hypothetical protein